MALTRDFRETVQADARRDPVFRRRLLSESLESPLGGEVELGKELLRGDEEEFGFATIP